MAQSRLRNYLHPIQSFDHNKFNLGMHNAGRYAGFDTITWTALNALTFRVAHTNTGIKFKDANETINGPCGVALSPQGTLVFDDAPVGDDSGNPLAIVTNAGNSFIRYDILVMSHSYVAEPGGQDALYSVVQGAIGASTIPTVADDLHDIIIGIFSIAANASGSNGTILWTPTECPDSGDGKDARLNLINQFTKLNMEKTSSTTLTTPAKTETISGLSVAGGFWDLKSDGNNFRIIPGSQTSIVGIRLLNSDGLTPVIPQDGTKIKLILSNNAFIASEFGFNPIPSGDQTLGYRPINVNAYGVFPNHAPALNDCVWVDPSFSYPFIQEGPWLLSLIYDGNTGFWNLYALSSSPMGMVVPPTPPTYPWTSAILATVIGTRTFAAGAGTGILLGFGDASGLYQIQNPNKITWVGTVQMTVSVAGPFNLKIPAIDSGKHYKNISSVICVANKFDSTSTGQVIDQAVGQFIVDNPSTTNGFCEVLLPSLSTTNSNQVWILNITLIFQPSSVQTVI